MRSLFAPAVALLNRLRYTTKFMLICAIAGIASSVLLGQIILQSQAQLRAVDREQDGLGVLQAAMGALTLMQQHRGMTAGLLGGDQSLGPKIAAKAAALDEAIAKVDAALAGPGAGYGVDGAWGAIKRQWQPLKAGRPAERGANFAAHTAMVKETLSLLVDIGTASNLAFDPDPATANLMAVLLREVPEMSERFGRLRGFGTGILARGVLTVEDERALYQHLAQLEVTHAGLVDRLTRAAAHHAPIEGALGAAIKDISAGHAAVRDSARSEILEQRFSIAPAAFFAVGTGAIDRLLDHTEHSIAASARNLLVERHAALSRTLAINLVVSGIAIVLVGYLMGGMYFTIVGSVRELTAGARQLASGDYTARVAFSARDELAQVADQFNDMADHLRSIISQVKRGAEEVGAAASHMARAAAEVAQGSERQSESASSMAAAIEQMTVGVDEIARHAQAAAEKSAASGKLASDGGLVVRQSVEEMERIAGTVNQAAEVIRELGQRSGRISTIVNAISEIAEQTNLLALNAAIEAARAGESGRGFAVVADEVRKLAERTANATREITDMVEAIQGGTDRAVGTMEHGVERVREGVELTTRAGQSMHQIDDGARSVQESVGEISHALREQTAASTEIARNVESIAQMSERNSASVKDTSETAARLERLARALSDEVARFRV